MKKNSERVSREMFSTLSRPTSTVTSPFITLRHFSLPKKDGPTAFLITISKKDIPTAVERNMFRRRYTHILRKKLPETLLGGVIQCIVKKTATRASFAELSLDVEQGLRKIKI